MAKGSKAKGVNNTIPPPEVILPVPEEVSKQNEEQLTEEADLGLSEFSIKEIMVQKLCTRNEAIRILKNPIKD